MIKGVIGLIAIFSIVILIDFKSLSDTKKAKKTMGIYFTILIIGFVISLLQVIDKAPPSPGIYIEKAIDKIAPNR